MGKSVADGKNLIGSVVGGDSNSSFATLANNAQSIKNTRDSYASQLTNMTNDRNNWMNIANSRPNIVARASVDISCNPGSTTGLPFNLASYIYDILVIKIKRTKYGNNSWVNVGSDLGYVTEAKNNGNDTINIRCGYGINTIDGQIRVYNHNNNALVTSTPETISTTRWGYDYTNLEFEVGNIRRVCTYLYNNLIKIHNYQCATNYSVTLEFICIKLP